MFFHKDGTVGDLLVLCVVRDMREEGIGIFGEYFFFRVWKMPK